MKTLDRTAAAVAALLLLGAGAALAHEGMTGPVKVRHDGMKAIGASVKGLFESLNKGESGEADVRTYAARIHQLAPQTAGWFPKGSGPESGQKMLARAEIWTKPTEFEAMRRTFVAEAAKMNAVAKTGDAAAVRAQFATLRGSCKSCHDQFKAKD